MLAPMKHQASVRAGCLVALLSAIGLAQTQPEILEADLRRHVETLASDAMQGRSTGTPQAMEAARYLAAELARARVAPAGEDGTYFQKVPMVRTEYLAVPKLSLVRFPETAAASMAVAGVDFELGDGGCEARTLGVVLAKSAAEIPAKADPNLALVLATSSTKERTEWLASAGHPEGRGFGLLVTLGPKEPGRNPMSGPPRARSRKPSSVPRISVRGALRAEFEAGSIQKLCFEAPLRTLELESVNVLGKLAGTSSTPERAAEFVMFSAHYDHLGVGNGPEGEDRIYNGADDDASGCAVVLELAEAFAAGQPPARSLCFFFATGEEIGLVGTRHFLEQPLVPLDKLVLDVNFEMLGRPDPLLAAPARMWLTGFEFSDLGPEFQRLSLPVVADPHPEQNFFQRSDNYALAQRGIVAQTLSSYGLHTDYHKVSDEAKTLDYAHMEACAKAALAGCRAIAGGDFKPSWLEGKDPSKNKPRSRPGPGGSEPAGPASRPPGKQD